MEGPRPPRRGRRAGVGVAAPLVGGVDGSGVLAASRSAAAAAVRLGVVAGGLTGSSPDQVALAADRAPRADLAAAERGVRPARGEDTGDTGDCGGRGPSGVSHVPPSRAAGSWQAFNSTRNSALPPKACTCGATPPSASSRRPISSALVLRVPGSRRSTAGRRQAQAGGAAVGAGAAQPAGSLTPWQAARGPCIPPASRGTRPPPSCSPSQQVQASQLLAMHERYRALWEGPSIRNKQWAQIQLGEAANWLLCPTA